MSKDYVDSVYFIRKSERADYNKGVNREYDVYLDGEVIWVKFKPNFTYCVRVSQNSFTKYVLNFENSLVRLVPSKKDKDSDSDVTYNNLYINNIDGDVVLDYETTGEGKIDVNDYLDVSVKCKNIKIVNCDTPKNNNMFMGMIASNMSFVNCNMECFVKGNYLDGVSNLELDNSFITCNINCFAKFDKIKLDGSSLIFNSNRVINIYTRRLELSSSMFGLESSSGNRIAFKYLDSIDSKINSSNSGLCIQGIKDANLVNTVIGNTTYNNDITIDNIIRDKLSIIYNNVSEKDSLSYIGFIERYRGELRGLYLGGVISEFEYNKIISDLDDFLDSLFLEN